MRMHFTQGCLLIFILSPDCVSSPLTSANFMRFLVSSSHFLLCSYPVEIIGNSVSSVIFELKFNGHILGGGNEFCPTVNEGFVWAISQYRDTFNSFAFGEKTCLQSFRKKQCKILRVINCEFRGNILQILSVREHL